MGYLPQRACLNSHAVSEDESANSSAHVLVVHDRGFTLNPVNVTQATRADLLRAPFNASPETASKFLRNLRTLKLHALATSAMNHHHGRNTHDKGEAGGPADRSQMLSGWGAVGDTDADVSQWQERKHTIRKVRSWGRAYTAITVSFISAFKRKHPAAETTPHGTYTTINFKAAPT